MAAWTAYSKIDSIVWMITAAFGISITTFVAQNIGAKRFDRVKKSVRVCYVMIFIATLTLSGSLLLLGERLYHLFTDDPLVIKYGMQILHELVPWYFAFNGIEVFSGAVRGAGDTLVPMLMTLVGVCLFRVAWVIAIVPYHYHFSTLLLSYPISWGATSLLFFLYYWKGGWLKRYQKRLAQLS